MKAETFGELPHLFSASAEQKFYMRSKTIISSWTFYWQFKGFMWQVWHSAEHSHQRTLRCQRDFWGWQAAASKYLKALKWQKRKCSCLKKVSIFVWKKNPSLSFWEISFCPETVGFLTFWVLCIVPFAFKFSGLMSFKLAKAKHSREPQKNAVATSEGRSGNFLTKKKKLSLCAYMSFKFLFSFYQLLLSSWLLGFFFFPTYQIYTLDVGFTAKNIMNKRR